MSPRSQRPKRRAAVYRSCLRLKRDLTNAGRSGKIGPVDLVRPFMTDQRFDFGYKVFNAVEKGAQNQKDNKFDAFWQKPTKQVRR